MGLVPKLIFGISRPELVFRCSTDTKNLSRLSPGPGINGRWPRVLSIDAYASGTWHQVSVFVFYLVIGLTSARWNSASRESESSLDPGTELSGFGIWRPARCCKNSRAIGTGSIMLFSTQARLGSCQEGATIPSGCGKSVRDNACDRLRGPMCSVSPGIPTGDVSFHAPETSASGTRRPANPCGCLRGTGTQFDPSLGVTISATSSRLPMIALCGFGKRRRAAVLKCFRATTSVLSMQSGPWTAGPRFPATPAVDCARSQWTQHPIPRQTKPTPREPRRDT